MNNDYHTDLSAPCEGMEYNEDLIKNVRNVTDTYKSMG